MTPIAAVTFRLRPFGRVGRGRIGFDSGCSLGLTGKQTECIQDNGLNFRSIQSGRYVRYVCSALPDVRLTVDLQDQRGQRAIALA
jgi:hypothetical protein